LSKLSEFKWVLLLLLWLLWLPWMGLTPSQDLKGKKLKGEYWENASLTNQLKGEKACTIEIGEGIVWQITLQQENPQFQEETQISFLLWMAKFPEPGEKYYLNQENSLICYREEGTLLLFETFRANGWVKIEAMPRKKKLEGELEIQLIEPHHNFSNGDFQHLGGEFKLEMGSLIP